MSFFVNTKARTHTIEIMDDFSLSGAVLFDTLEKLDTINKWLGGTMVTLNGIKQLLKEHPGNKPLTIIDLGCGGGGMLRNIANYGRKKGYTFNLIGVDANEHIVGYAREKSREYGEISYLQHDVFSKEFNDISYDIALSTLFLHHFKENEIFDLLGILSHNATIGIVVNDLHRHPMAYYLFKLLGLFIENKMVREDGLTSILRGFKKEELQKISTQLELKSQIHWKWAFRYQWIIE